MTERDKLMRYLKSKRGPGRPAGKPVLVDADPHQHLRDWWLAVCAESRRVRAEKAAVEGVKA